MRRLLLFVLAQWIAMSACVAGRADDVPLAFVGATVLDGKSNTPVADAVVNVARGRIVSWGPRATTPPAAGARVISLRGKWILPGLIDAHVHFFQSGGLYTRPDVIDLRRVRPYAQELAWIRARLPFTMSRYDCSGITSVGDVGGGLWTLAVRQRAEAPRVAAAGPLISMLAPRALEVADPAIWKVATATQARAAVRRIAARSPDFIKLWMVDTGDLSQMAPVYRAAAEEAHAKGLRVFAHATELATARLAVAIGTDVLVHAVDDEPIDDPFIASLRARGVITVSTLAVEEGYRTVLSRTARVSDFARRCGDPQVIATWRELPRGRETRIGGPSPVAGRNLKRLLDAGLPVAAGSDAGNIGTLHGPGLHRELELLVAAGFTPAQAIRAATGVAARVLSPHPDFGTIAPGNAADLLVVDRDPQAGVGHLTAIDRVIRNGRTVWPRRVSGTHSAR